ARVELDSAGGDMTYQISLSSPAPGPGARQVGAIAVAVAVAAIILLSPLLPAYFIAWPRELILPLAKNLTFGLKWIAETDIVNGLSLKDLTRSFATVIQWPTKMLQMVLADGVSSGFGAQQTMIVPPL